MKKNILYRIYAAVFVVMCLAPSALMPVIKSGESKEKRELADLPKVKTEDGKLNFDYFDEFETYFSEHFAFRQQLVTLDGRLKASVFGTSANSDVIVGKEGWLYYAQTADDFLNINTLSNRAINNIKNNLEMLNDYCIQNGARFIFTIAPNKNSVYPDYMPSNYIRNGMKGNYEKLVQSFSADFPYCDMKTAILKSDSSIPLYHKEDTHWNNLGAYVGHVALMDMLGRDICPAGQWYTKNDRQGDLAAMIYPSESADDIQVYNDYEYTYQYSGRFHALDDITIDTVCDGKTGSLLMYRDSYGEAVLPYMAECFGNAEFSRTVPYRTDKIGNGEADTVILEIVERNIPNLQKYAPVMPAPQVSDYSFTSIGKSRDFIVKSEESGNYIHIFGELGEDFFRDDDVSIYVTVNGNTYRAFNAFEDKLLGREGETSDRGFSLYILNTRDISTENIVVTAISGSGKLVTTEQDRD